VGCTQAIPRRDLTLLKFQNIPIRGNLKKCDRKAIANFETISRDRRFIDFIDHSDSP
jgi:hypothetical protein